MAKNLDVSVLIDYYGDMLTNKQRDFLIYYYNDDLSLSEIAENEGITRQGVRDAIKRAEKQLFEMESRLGLVKKFTDFRNGMNAILEYANKINEYNMRYGLSREINETVVQIKAIAQDLCE
ncbi:MAG: DNA-binding protein [Oscillospiraceae bacterium]|nr:DNA-binding protein [Oscillospiraceae bacterium]